MGHNAERAQVLQDEFAQRRASLQQDSAEAQALQGKEALLANIIEEEMAYQTQVSVLSHLHLQQAKEIKSQSDEIRHLSTLFEKQQAILERVQEQQSRMSEIPVPPTSRIEELQREAFNIYIWYCQCQKRCSYSTCLSNFAGTFQSLAGPTLRMNWLRKPHGLHITIHNMYTSLPTLKGD